MHSPVVPSITPVTAPSVGVGVSTLLQGGRVSFARVLALGATVAIAPGQTGSLFEERTGGSATTATTVGNRVGSAKNWGALGGWLTAPSDSARPFLRLASNGRPYLEYDGVDDVLFGALGALRNGPGYTMVVGARLGAVSNTLIFVSAATPGSTRAGIFTNSSGMNLGGRRLNADSFASSGFMTPPVGDAVIDGVGNFTETTGSIAANGVVGASNPAWLTPGLSSADGGGVGVGASDAPSGFTTGRIYSALLFPTALAGDQLALARRWTAQQMGITI